MGKVRSKHKFWPTEYVVAVTKGSKTRYFYGQRRKDAIEAAGKALNGRVFSVARFVRESVVVAERRPNGLIEVF